MKLLERILWTPDADPDSLLLPQIDKVTDDEFVMRYRSLEDKTFRREIRQQFWRSERGALSLPIGPGQLMVPITNRAWPQFTGAVAPTPVAVTPTTLGSTTARVFPFMLDGSIQVAKIYLHTPNIVASSFQFGVFSFNGTTQKYASGTQSTTANSTTLSPTAFKISSGLTNIAAITNANLTSATTAYFFTAALASAFLPRWGTITATAGAMPATFTPGSTTATVGGWPIVVLSAV